MPVLGTFVISWIQGAFEWASENWPDISSTLALILLHVWNGLADLALGKQWGEILNAKIGDAWTYLTQSESGEGKKAKESLRKALNTTWDNLTDLGTEWGPKLEQALVDAMTWLQTNTGNIATAFTTLWQNHLLPDIMGAEWYKQTEQFVGAIQQVGLIPLLGAFLVTSISDAFDWAGENMSGMSEKLLTVLTSAWTGLVDLVVGEKWAKHLGQLLSDTWNYLAGRNTQAGQESKDHLQGMLSTTWDTVHGIGKEWGIHIADFILEGLDWVKENISPIAESLRSILLKALKNLTTVGNPQQQMPNLSLIHI